MSEGSAGAGRPPGRGPAGPSRHRLSGADRDWLSRTSWSAGARREIWIAKRRDARLAVGRTGAGGFTRAPGGRGFQFGLGADFAEEAGVRCTAVSCRGRWRSRRPRRCSSVALASPLPEPAGATGFGAAGAVTTAGQQASPLQQEVLEPVLRQLAVQQKLASPQ